jgi:hypothetical protein
MAQPFGTVEPALGYDPSAMATTGPAPPGSHPVWYRRLPPSLQRVAAASDRVSFVTAAFGAGAGGSGRGLPSFHEAL